MPCDLAIPTLPGGGTIDFARVNLRVTRGGNENDVPCVQRAERCQPARSGWHYDADPALRRRPVDPAAPGTTTPTPDLAGGGHYDADPAGGGKPTRIVMCPRHVQELAR